MTDERFWSKVDRSGSCWLWLGARCGYKYDCGGGYGILTRNRVCVLAHRHSWALHNGPVPDGLSVLHRCDVPLCVRPDHLFLGTQADNGSDMSRKGRSTRGERSSSALLTEQQVREIRRRAGPETHQQLASIFGVSRPTITYVVQRRTWAHVVEDLA